MYVSRKASGDERVSGNEYRTFCIIRALPCVLTTTIHFYAHFSRRLEGKLNLDLDLETTICDIFRLSFCPRLGALIPSPGASRTRLRGAAKVPTFKTSASGLLAGLTVLSMTFPLGCIPGKRGPCQDLERRQRSIPNLPHAKTPRPLVLRTPSFTQPHFCTHTFLPPFPNQPTTAAPYQ